MWVDRDDVRDAPVDDWWAHHFVEVVSADLLRRLWADPGVRAVIGEGDPRGLYAEIETELGHNGDTSGQNPA